MKTFNQWSRLLLGFFVVALVSCTETEIDEDKPTITDIAMSIGNSVASHESVAAAFAIVRLADGDPWQAALMAANIGDDTDTIGAIAGAMAGACSGISTIPKDAITTIRKANNLALETVACHLLALRHHHPMIKES